MVKKILDILILLGILLMVTSATVAAQSMPGKTSTNELPLPAAMTSAGGGAMESPWMEAPALFCMNIDRDVTKLSRKRLVLDKSLQELKWAAEHGPRRELLEEFLARPAGEDRSADAGQIAWVGGSVDTWSETLSGAKRQTVALFAIEGLDVTLIGPESAVR